MGTQWQSADLPSTPIHHARPKTPEEREADAAAWNEIYAELERRPDGAATYAARKARETPEQRARKLVQDRTLARRQRLGRTRTLLRKAAAARTYARYAWVLDRGGQGWSAANESQKLTTGAEHEMKRIAKQAADGCALSAEFIADAEVIALYDEARASMPADHLAAIETINARRASSRLSAADRTPQT